MKKCVKYSNAGNVVLMVAFLTLIAMGFFVFLSSSVMKILNQTNNIRNANIANFAGESMVEQSIVEYFKDRLSPPASVLNENKDLCVTSNDPKEAVIDFFNCTGGDSIGTIERNVTRYKRTVDGFLNRYKTTELWFTDNENETEFAVSGIKSVKLEWNISDIIHEKASIAVVIARWPKDTPRNIQTNHILLNPQEGRQEFEIFDFRKPTGIDSGRLFKTEDYDYIIFLRTQEFPTHYRLTGLDENKNTVYLPSKYVTIKVKTIVTDERDTSKTITKQIQVQKQIYTDYDSTFPYVKHLLD